MKRLYLHEVDVPTYNFGVQKTISISSTRVMFRVHHILHHGEVPFQYLDP